MGHETGWMSGHIRVSFYEAIASGTKHYKDYHNNWNVGNAPNHSLIGPKAVCSTLGSKIVHFG